MIKDSGERRSFETGAVRDMSYGINSVGIHSAFIEALRSWC